MSKLRVCTAFSGYDSQCLALDMAGVDYELVAWLEIDKYAIKAHNALFPQYADRNFGDITKIDWSRVPDFDFFTYSSPCQSFSIAGERSGGEEGSGTKSSLLWECRRAILAKKPKYLMMENVKNLVCKDFVSTFLKWEEELRSYGYVNYSQVLNAKDYGIPQNRERIFVVSVLDDKKYFSFPKGWKLNSRLVDYMDKDVDAAYFLPDNIVEKYLPIETDFNKEGDEVIVTGCIDYDRVYEMCRRVYPPRGIAPTITTRNGWQCKKIMIAVDDEAVYGISRTRDDKGHIKNVSLKDYTMCLTSFSATGIPTMRSLILDCRIPKTTKLKYIIRNLTPNECFRLMGVRERERESSLPESPTRSSTNSRATQSSWM